MQEENTNYTPPVYPVNKPRKGVAIFVVIATIVIIAIIAVGGFFAYQYFFNKVNTTETENLTAGWKTYTNSQYGFEFQYPKDWLIEKGNIEDIIIDNDKYVSVWSSKAAKQYQEELRDSGLLGGPNGSDFGVKYCDDACQQQIRKDWGFEATEIPIEDIFRERYSASFKEILIDGKKAYEWTAISSIGTYTTYIPLSRGGYFLSAPENDPKIISIIKEILSTFKFTNQPTNNVQPVEQQFTVSSYIKNSFDLNNKSFSIISGGKQFKVLVTSTTKIFYTVNDGSSANNGRGNILTENVSFSDFADNYRIGGCNNPGICMGLNEKIKGFLSSDGKTIESTEISWGVQ